MHEPALLKEVVDFLRVRKGGTYIDGTAGGGGHTVAILERVGPAGRVLALDRDPEAVQRLRQKVASVEGTCVVEQANFAGMREAAGRHGIQGADGLVLDLGVSSDQLDTPRRGFSFASDGPLDMRMDPGSGESAADLVNRLSERELADILWTYGEERRSRQIARRIVQERERAPIRTTAQLGDLVALATGGRRGRTHPATRTFQALRIEVNGELEALRKGLAEGLAMVGTGGRMAVISFHSLEDRIVKRFFAAHAGRWESLPQGGRRWEGEHPPVARVTRKPVRPGAAELERNPRARSAKLRVAERKAGNGTQE